MTVLALVRAGATDPGVNVNQGGLPGMTQLQNMAGGLMFGALILCVVGVIVGAALWAVGSNSSNHQAASRGKTGVMVSTGAAILVGAANFLVSWGSGIGSQIQ